MSLLNRVEALERQASECPPPRFVRFVSAGDATLHQPVAYDDRSVWRCDREAHESAEMHKARASALGLERGVHVLFEC
jgi:hypothetical protein